jgi:hypothetical protein
MKQLVPLLCLAMTFTGCVVIGPPAVPGHLYPIQGPLSTQTPAPITAVSLLHDPGSDTGTLLAYPSEGEVCQGTLTPVMQSDTSADNMSAEWDLVYGQGFFVANVLGTPFFFRAVLDGNQGTRFNVQIYNSGPRHINAFKGVATDNKGNTFKLTF